jgi:hypothetical protein
MATADPFDKLAMKLISRMRKKKNNYSHICRGILEIEGFGCGGGAEPIFGGLLSVYISAPLEMMLSVEACRDVHGFDDPSVQVKTLILSNLNLTDSSLKGLVSILRERFSACEVLDLSFNNLQCLDIADVRAILDILSCLDLRGNHRLSVISLLCLLTPQQLCKLIY